MVEPARVLWSPASCSGVRRPSTTWLVSTLVSRPLGSFIAASSVALGSAANASLTGAKTVMSWAELRVSPRPASPTAVTRVLRRGLLLAAVATGSVAMPSNEPLPEVGTAEQPAPKGLAIISSVVVLLDELEDELDELGAAAAVSSPDPHAARPSGRARQRVAIVVRRAVRMRVTPCRGGTDMGYSDHALCRIGLSRKKFHSGDEDHDGVVAGGAVGEGLGPLGGLHLPRAVCGAHGQVVSTAARLPRPGPLAPVVGAPVRAERGLLPRAVVDADLDPVDPAALRPGDPTHGDPSRLGGAEPARRVDP